MTTKTAVEAFISQPSIAVVGVSRNPQKFGTMAYKDLKAKGMRLFPVTDKMETIEGDKCYPDLSSLPEKVGGALIIVQPAQAAKVVEQAYAAGIQNVWLQQGSESPAAIQFGQEHNMNLVTGECILMFARPKFPHTAHRWVWGLIGKLPK